MKEHLPTVLGSLSAMRLADCQSTAEESIKRHHPERLGIISPT